jgi:hypothetical protein
MQTQLARAAPDDPAHYPPLVFELNAATESARIYIQQIAGIPAPDFAERGLDLVAAPDLEALEAILRDYVRCVLDAQPPAIA